MAVKSGKSGVIKDGTGIIGEVRSYTLNQTAEVVDATSFGAGTWRKSVPMFNSWTGELEAFYDPADARQSAFTIGSTVSIEVCPTGDTSGEPVFSGDAVVTSRNVSGSVDNLVMISLSLTGVGELVEDTIS